MSALRQRLSLLGGRLEYEREKNIESAASVFQDSPKLIGHTMVNTDRSGLVDVSVRALVRIERASRPVLQAGGSRCCQGRKTKRQG